MVEAGREVLAAGDAVFQSAGRIIGWLKWKAVIEEYQIKMVSIRRADYWLVEGGRRGARCSSAACFNPPGGLLVG